MKGGRVQITKGGGIEIDGEQGLLRNPGPGDVEVEYRLQQGPWGKETVEAGKHIVLTGMRQLHYLTSKLWRKDNGADWQRN